MLASRSSLKTPWNLVMFAIVLLFVPGANGQSYQLIVNTSTPMASARSDYTFEIQQEDDLNFTSTTSVQITLPADYQAIMSDGNFACYISQWIDGATVNPITCALVGLTFTISGAFAGIVGSLLVPAYTIYAFVINQLTNPMYADTTAAFTGLFTNTATNTAIFVFETNFGMSGIQITQGSMACSVTSTVSTTTSSSGMIISITPVIMIPYNTTITILMQKYWPSNAFNTTLILSSVSCQNGTNTSSTIQCGLIIKPNSLEILVGNVVGADVGGGIQFYVYSINNPPTTEPQGVIDIIAKKDGNKIMAKCSGNKMTGIQPINFISASYLATNYAVNALTSVFVSFKINSLVLATDTIEVTLPATITAVNLLTYVVFNGNTPNYSPIVIFNANTSTTTVRTNGASSGSGSTIQLQLYNVKNPPSQATTSSIGIALKRNNYLMEQLDTTTNPLLFKARRGAITGSISATTTEVGVQADYTINIQLTNEISSSSDSLVIVYFPTLYSNSLSASSSCVPACLTLTSTKAVFLASSIASLTTTSLSCTLKLMSLINPLQIGTTTSLTINTQLYGTNTESIVDQIASGLSLNLTSREMTSVSISSNSAVVYNYPTTFTITATNNNPVPAYSSLLITLPTAISVQEARLSCLVGVRSVPCSYNSTTHTITMTSITSVAIGASGLPAVYLHNLFNPSSTMPTSTFKFYIINSFSQTIEHKQSGLTYSASSATTFTTISVTPNSVTNSHGSTSLAISFSLNFDDGYVNNSLLVINLPTQVANIGTTTCTPTSTNLQSIVCTKSATTIKARLVFSSLAAGVEVSYRIEFYTNYPSIQPYNILLTLYTGTLEQYKIVEETVTKVNSVLSPIAITSFSFSNGILSESTVLTFSITPTYTGSDLSQIWVTFPSEFVVSGGSCSSLPVGLTCTVAGNVFKLIESSANYAWTMPLQLSLTGITGPSYTPSTGVTMESKSSTGYLMSRDISMKFTTSCSLPCRTCSPTDSTLCLSCYSNPALVSSKTMLSGNQCVSACANRLYFNNNTGQCDSCSSTCQLCIDYAYCTSCPTGVYLYRYNNTCVGTCPFGYYPSISYTCELCTPALFCASCSNDYQCLTCTTGYFFYQHLCMQSCPAPTTYSNSILRTCQPCPSNCTKCTGSVTASSSNVACTQCSPAYFFDTSTQRCFLQCLVPGTVPNGNQCVSCQAPCLSCSLTSTNCTSCDTSASSVNKYLHNNRCLSICPPLYYQSNSNYSCILCTSPCQTCTSASINSCVSCIAGTYLHGSSCVGTCPNLYYPNVYQCTACVAPCLNCISQLQCTSCVSGKFLYGSNCVSACDPGMTVINGNECLVCSSSCKTCSTATYCTSCYPTNYLYNGTCSILCPNSTYRDSGQQICQPCTSPCSDCSASNYCITCVNTALYVENGVCVPTCSGNLIPVNSMCTACNPVCSTCSVTITNCLRCASTYYFVYSNTTIPNCVSSCSSGYIYDNRNATNNYQCLLACPVQYYSTGLGTACLPCDTGCYSCTALPANCSACLSSYYLHSNTNTCTQTCPVSAPYATLYANPTSGRCQMCNMTICGTCQMLHSCATCKTNSTLRLLVYEGITSRLHNAAENKTCISACPTNYTYSAASLLCTVNTNNNTNNTNNTSNSTSDSTATTSTWTYKLIPNYLFTIISVCFLPIVAISKYQMPPTNVQMSMYVLFALLTTASLAHVLYFEGLEIFTHTPSTTTSSPPPYTRVGAVSGSDFMIFSNLTIYVHNPTTILSIVALFLHVFGTVVLLISLACTRDYSLIPVIHSHPIFSIVLLLLLCVEYKLIWVLNCALFGAEVLMVKYCQISTVRILKVITVIGLTELIMELVYAVYVLVLALKATGSTRLLLSNAGLPSSVAYLHPYIQLIIMSSLTIFLTICVLTTKEEEYYIEKVPQIAHTLLQEKQEKQTKKTNNLSENNESMNELLSEKDAAFRRFSTDDIYRDIDDTNIAISADSDYLHDFGVGTHQIVSATPEDDILNATKKSQGGKLTKMSHRSNRSSRSHKSKTEVQRAEVDVQVNLDEMLLPNIVEEDQNDNTEKPKEGQVKQDLKNEISIMPVVAVTEKKEKLDDIANKPPEQKQAEVQKKQQEVELKSQPSWSSFKLGQKYKQVMLEQEEYLGYVCRTENGHGEQGVGGVSMLLDKHGELVASKTTNKSPEVKNNRMKVIELDSESEEIDEMVEQQEQQYVEDDIASSNNKDSRLHIVTNRIQEESEIPSVSQQQLYYHEEQELHNSYQKTNSKAKPLTYREEQPSRIEEEEYEEQIQLVRPNTQSVKSKQETVLSNKQTLSILNKNSDQSQHQDVIQESMLSQQSSVMINDPQFLKKSARNNIFYHDQEPAHEELLSENIPDEYRMKEPSQESEPFEQFKMDRDIEEKESALAEFGGEEFGYVENQSADQEEENQEDTRNQPDLNQNAIKFNEGPQICLQQKEDQIVMEDQKQQVEYEEVQYEQEKPEKQKIQEIKQIKQIQEVQQKVEKQNESEMEEKLQQSQKKQDKKEEEVKEKEVEVEVEKVEVEMEEKEEGKEEVQVQVEMKQQQLQAEMKEEEQINKVEQIQEGNKDESKLVNDSHYKNQTENAIDNKDLNQSSKEKRRQEKNPQSLLALLKNKRTIKKITPVHSNLEQFPTQADGKRGPDESNQLRNQGYKNNDPPQRDISSYKINDRSNDIKEQLAEDRVSVRSKKTQKGNEGIEQEKEKCNEIKGENNKSEIGQHSNIDEQLKSQQQKSIVGQREQEPSEQKNLDPQKKQPENDGQEGKSIKQIKISNQDRISSKGSLQNEENNQIAEKQKIEKSSRAEQNQVGKEQSKIPSVHTLKQASKSGSQNQKRQNGGENRNLLRNQIELIRKHRPERSQILQLSERKDKAEKQEKAQEVEMYIEREQTEHHTEMNTKNRRTKKIEIEYDDAEHFNEHHLDYPKQEEINDNIEQIIYRAPSQMGASLLIVHDDTQQQEKSQSNQNQEKEDEQNADGEEKESIKESEHKQHGITFIEDLNELDEIVKTPIRILTTKSKPKPNYLSRQQEQDTKPSQFIYNKKTNISKPAYPTTDQGNKSNRSIPTKQQQHSISLKPKFTYSNAQKDKTKRSEKMGEIIYEEEDAQYQGEKERTKRSNPRGVPRYNTIGHDSERKSSQDKASDQKPSAILRGSFQKIGANLIKGNQEK